MHVLKIGTFYIGTDGNLTDRQADAQRLIPEHVEGMRQWIAARPDYLRSDLRLVRIVTRAERAERAE